jgi:Tol biopolymer transport system component
MLNGRNRPHYRSVITLVLGAAVALLLSGCMWGFVTDATTGDPIPGATVKYTDANGITVSTTTGANGLYAFDQAMGPYPAPGTAAMEISAPGYDTLTTSVAVAYDDNANATLANLSSFWEVRSFGLQPTAAAAQIAFTSHRDGNYEIYVMDADGSGQTRLTNNPADDDFAAWSPDRSQIAFQSNRDGDYEIFVMDADGGGQTQLTSDPAADLHPAWSPDGSKIAFTSNRDGDYEIFVMNADGTGQTQITSNAASDAAPAWSPNGNKIAFMSDRDGNFEIYVMNAKGSGQTSLTNSAAAELEPTWSPDGSQMAFESNRDGPMEIYVMNHNGAHQTRLTHNAAADYAPAW